MAVVILGYITGLLDLYMFWKSNKVYWLALAVFQIVLSGVLLTILNTTNNI